MSKLWVALLAVVLAVCHRTSAITSGSPTTIEKHPYQVAIDSVTYSEDDSSKKYQYTATMLCSGALLSKSTVITAASCIMGTSEQTPSNTKVRVGAQFREGGGETYDVASWLVNPNLDLYSGDYDLMLVFLDGEVTLRNGVQTVPLVDPAVGFNSGETLFLTGYGDLDETTRDAEGQVQLQAVALPAFNIDICLYAYNIYYNFAPKGCAGGWGAGMCGTRDIGSPIVNWRRQLVGVAIQQKNKCGVLGLPTVFTSLADADINKWIVANAKDLPV